MKGRNRRKEVLAILGCFGWIFCFACVLRAPVFCGGTRYTLYTGTSSGEIVPSSQPFLQKLTLPVYGESACYEGNRVEETLSVFRAIVRRKEEIDGKISFYCDSPLLGEGVFIDGEKINLHIVLGEDTLVGTPLVFGGY